MSHRHLSLHISQVEPSAFPANLIPLPAFPIWLSSSTMDLTSEVRSPGVILNTSASSVCYVQLLSHSVSWLYVGSSFLCTATPSTAPDAGLNHHLPLPWLPPSGFSLLRSIPSINTNQDLIPIVPHPASLPPFSPMPVNKAHLLSWYVRFLISTPFLSFAHHLYSSECAISSHSVFIVLSRGFQT